MARNSHSIGEPLFPYETQPERPEEIASREEYCRRLAEYLKDPQFRAIEGFPIGSDEDILALSDPPYYTACPNPFLSEIIEQWQTERLHTRRKLNLPEDDSRYHREPFAADVSEGKTDPIYNAHSYHTKVPHKAIMRYILHYTDPGDVVFDGFCGTGMTGVAAQLCGDKATVEELGYLVKPDGRITDASRDNISRLGIRKAILNDLSPAATFIASNYNNPIDSSIFSKEAERVLKETENELSWMYETWHPNCDDPKKERAKINFTIWSEVFICPHCGSESIFWDAMVNKDDGELLNEWICSNCQAKLSKNPSIKSDAIRVEHSLETIFDPYSNQTIRRVKLVPVQINYNYKGVKLDKKPDASDLELINKIEDFKIPSYMPTQKMLDKEGIWGDQWRAGTHEGITHIHHFYIKRGLILSSALYDFARKREIYNLQRALIFWIQSVSLSYTRLNRYLRNAFSQVNRQRSGTLYVPSLVSDVSPQYALRGKISRLSQVFSVIGQNGRGNAVCTGSSTGLHTIPDRSLDYIFVDPPFGGNLMYSELNFIWEAWLKVLTKNRTEAIVSQSQQKKLQDYQGLMEKCFAEFKRILKAGHWMTIEFHNSQNIVWNSIQEALLQAGFVIADVRTFDKQQGSYNQVTATGAVKQDLIISSYKPNDEFEKKFSIEGGSEAAAWAFVRQHLDQLPLPGLHNNTLETQSERMAFLLYDRLVAFHLVRGFTVPLSAGDFYASLGNKFLVRDGMYFTSSQAADYDRLRLKAERVEQLAFFVTDEQTAIQWLRQFLETSLGGKSQTYAEIQPEFLKQLHQEKHEKMPELMVILEQNFLQDGAGQWYVPNPDKQSDLDALRSKALLHEFSDYLKSKGKLKLFRSEAVRAGFSKAWKDRDYETIVKVGDRLPDDALQEDPNLKMYYNNALSRYQRGPRQEPLL